MEVQALDQRHGLMTCVTSAPPTWFPEGGAALIAKKEGPPWSHGTATQAGEEAFDAAFTFGIVPTDAAARFATAEVRRRAFDLARHGVFSSLGCYNAPGNRGASVSLSGHVLAPAELDAALAALVAIHRA